MPTQSKNSDIDPKSIDWRQIDRAVADARPNIQRALALLRQVCSDPDGFNAAAAKLDPYTSIRLLAAWAALGIHSRELLTELETIDAVMNADRRRRRREADRKHRPRRPGPAGPQESGGRETTTG